MNILLDTCAVVWIVSDPDRLSARAQELVTLPDTGVFVSAISCAEIACLAEDG